VALEGLVDGRRLVDTPGDRLEISDVEDPRIEIAVPADHVEGMVVEHVTGEPVADLDAHLELAPLGVGLQLLRGADIALTVGACSVIARDVAIALGARSGGFRW
jgi:hypothetical protein